MLVLSQLESGPSSFTRVRRTSSLVCASWGIRLASLESNELFPYTERCLDGWSGHTPPKFKSNEDSSNYFCGREWTCVLCSHFLRGLYRVDDTIIITMIMHYSFSYNDDCVNCQCRHCCVDWAITLSKSYWLSCQNLEPCSWLSI